MYEGSEPRHRRHGDMYGTPFNEFGGFRGVGRGPRGVHDGFFSPRDRRILVDDCGRRHRGLRRGRDEWLD